MAEQPAKKSDPVLEYAGLSSPLVILIGVAGGIQTIKKPRNLRGLNENLQDYFRRRAATSVASPPKPAKASVVGSGAETMKY